MKMTIQPVVGPQFAHTYTGPCLIADLKNLNGRTYSSSNLHLAYRLFKAKIQAHAIHGQLDHPDDLSLHLEKASHVIQKVWLDDSERKLVLMAQIKTLPTEYGKMIEGLRQNVDVYLSTRGTGHVDEHGFVTNFEIVTIDLIGNSSWDLVNSGRENLDLTSFSPNIMAPAVEESLSGDAR